MGGGRCATTTVPSTSSSRSTSTRHPGGHAARVSVNGRPAKASYDVKVGDIIEIPFGARTLKVEVLRVADNVRKDDAVGLYREVQ